VIPDGWDRGVDLAAARWHHVGVPRPRAWLTLLALGLALLLVLGAFARPADAQAFKPRSRNGLAAKGLKKGPPTATAAAPAPAGTPAAAPPKAPPKKAPAAAPTAAAKPGPAKKPAKKKSKGDDDDDEVTVTDGD
jgi:hypothetical protein